MVDARNIAKSFFVATFIVLWVSLIKDHKYLSMAIFSMAFLVGLSLQGKTFFWKACFAFFALLSIIYSFKIFGGLEPNNLGIVASGSWFRIEVVLFLMMISSAVISLVIGLRTKDHRVN